MDSIERQITPRTRFLVLNDLQNPTAAECSPQEMEALSMLVLKNDLYVLCDEAYFDIRYSGKSISLASLPGMADRCVILSTFSKKFAMTGWRLGAAIGPREIIDVIARLNVNDESCSNHFVQYGVLAGLRGDQSGPRRILADSQGAPRHRRGDPELDCRRALLPAQRHLLPLSQRHKGHAENGARRLQ